MAESPPVKITHTVLRVCSVFLKTGTAKLSAYALSKQMKADYDVVWDTLGRMERAGWLQGEVERVNPSVVPRPPRRLYRMTPAGVAQARKLLSDLQVPGTV